MPNINYFSNNYIFYYNKINFNKIFKLNKYFNIIIKTNKKNLYQSKINNNRLKNKNYEGKKDSLLKGGNDNSIKGIISFLIQILSNFTNKKIIIY